MVKTRYRFVLSTVALVILPLQGAATTFDIPLNTTYTQTVSGYNSVTIEGALAISELDFGVVMTSYTGASLNNSGTISGTFDTAAVGASATHNIHIVNSGSITSNANNDSFSSTIIDLSHTSSSSILSNSGTISGDLASGLSAIYAVHSGDLTINNAGTMHAGAAAVFNLQYSTDIVLNNSGVISTGAANAIYVADSSNVTINNTYYITAAESFAINGTDAGYTTINNAGHIVAGDAVIVLGGCSTIINSGTIQATGDAGVAIDAGGNATIDLNSNSQVIGTVNLYQNSSLTNRGNMTADTGVSPIYVVDGTNTNIYNYNTITSDGTAPAINAGGAQHLTVTNDGTLSSGRNTVTLGAHNVLQNTGTITSDYLSLIAFNYNTIINSGHIVGTNVSSSNDLILLWDHNSLTNTGTISADTNAIYMTTNNTLVNSGVIEATGVGGVAVYSGTHASMTFESGSEVYGTVFVAAYSTLNEFGYVLPSDGYYAIVISGNSATLNVGEGTELDGQILINGGVDSVNIGLRYAPGSSYYFSFSDLAIVNDQSQGTQTPQTGKIAGIGAQEVADKLLFQRTTLLNDSFAQRLSQESPLEATWVSAYTGSLSRKQKSMTEQASAFNSPAMGITVGTTYAYSEAPLEAVLNLHVDHLNVQNKRQKVNSTGLLAGLLAPELYEYLGGRISGKVLAGYSKHTAHRVVFTDFNHGSISTFGKYHSTLAIAGLQGRWSEPFSRNLTWTINLGTDLALEHFVDFAENHHFSWKSRLLTQLSGYTEAAIRHHIPEDPLSFWASASILKHSLLSGKNFSFRLDNDAVYQYTNEYNTDIHGRVQTGLEYEFFGLAKVSVSADWSRSKHDVHKFQGRLNVLVPDSVWTR